MVPVVSCSDDVDLLGIGGDGCDVEGIVVRFGVDRDPFLEECLLCIFIGSSTNRVGNHVHTGVVGAPRDYTL